MCEAMTIVEASSRMSERRNLRFLPDDRIEGAHRLVEKDERRMMADRRDKGRLLLISGAESVDLLVERESVRPKACAPARDPNCRRTTP